MTAWSYVCFKIRFSCNQNKKIKNLFSNQVKFCSARDGSFQSIFMTTEHKTVSLANICGKWFMIEKGLFLSSIFEYCVCRVLNENKWITRLFPSSDVNIYLLVEHIIDITDLVTNKIKVNKWLLCASTHNRSHLAPNKILFLFQSFNCNPMPSLWGKEKWLIACCFIKI